MRTSCNWKRGCDVPNRSYAKGYRFERRVMAALSKQLYKVVRQGKSRFPDLIALPERIDGMKPGNLLIVECKVNKYIRADERVAFDEWKAYGECLVAYPGELRPGRHRDIIFCKPDNYEEVFRL